MKNRSALAGMRSGFAPVAKGYGLAFLGDLASRRIEPSDGFRSAGVIGRFLPLPYISRSRCLFPSRGRALLAFAPTIFFSPLPPAEALLLPSRAWLQELSVRGSITWHPIAALFAAIG